MSVFAKRLRELRIERQENQGDVAALLRVSVQSYSAYEGAREPKYDMLCKLAKHYDVTTDYLLGMSDVRKPTPESPFPIVDRMTARYSDQLTALASEAKEKGVYDELFKSTLAAPFPDYIDDAFLGAVKRCRQLLEHVEMFRVEGKEDTWNGNKILFFLGGDDSATQDDKKRTGRR